MLSLTRDLLRNAKDSTPNNQLDIKPLTVAFWTDFMLNPSLMYGLFSPHPRKLHYDPDRVKVMGTKDGMINQINISSVEDLESFHEQIIGVPMLLRIWVAHTGNDCIGSAPPPQHQQHIPIQGDFALLVDTTHPMIRPLLEAALDEARKILQVMGRFCIQIDFGPAIDSWLRSVHSCGQCLSCPFRNHEAVLYITNYAKPKHCLDCNPVWCIVFGPCWLLSAPCYKLFRLIKCRDIVVPISAPVVRRSVIPSTGRIVETTK